MYIYKQIVETLLYFLLWEKNKQFIIVNSLFVSLNFIYSVPMEVILSYFSSFEKHKLLHLFESFTTKMAGRAKYSCLFSGYYFLCSPYTHTHTQFYYPGITRTTPTFDYYTRNSIVCKVLFSLNLIQLMAGLYIYPDILYSVQLPFLLSGIPLNFCLSIICFS